MKEIKERLALLHDDLIRLERKIRSQKGGGDVSEWKTILRLAREVEAFAITQIALLNARKHSGKIER